MPFDYPKSLVTVEFGHGDVGICVAQFTQPDLMGLAFVPLMQASVGSFDVDFFNNNAEGFDIPVRMVFRNVESLDVLIGQCMYLRMVLTGEVKPATHLPMAI